MILPWFNTGSIKQRLMRVSLMSVAALVVIVAATYLLLSGVRRDVDLLVEERFTEIVENSRNSRDFAQVYTRMGIFREAFYGHGELVATEGRVIDDLLRRLVATSDEASLKQLLTQLQDEFETYHIRVRWINYLIEWRSSQLEELDELMQFIHQLLSDRERVVLLSHETEQLFQTRLQLRRVREHLTHLKNLPTSHNTTTVPPFIADRSDDAVVPFHLTGLAAALAQHGFPIEVLGRELVSRFEYLHHLIDQYLVVQEHLREREQVQQLLSNRILSAMAVLDQRNAMAVGAARAEIGKHLSATFVTAFGVLLLFLVMVLLSFRQLLTKDIETPIRQVTERLKDFQEGDHQAPLLLLRNDEWGEIETGFNDMLYSLEQSLTALRASEQQYREIFNNATEGIFRATLAGRYATLNPAGVAMLGHRSEGAALDYYTDLATQIYPDPSVRNRLMENLFKAGRNINFETQLYRKDGSLFWASISNHLVHDEDGSVRYIEGTFKDISGQRAAQEQLQQLKTLLQKIINSMPSIVIGVDKNLEITLWNLRAEVQTGLSAERVVGAPLSRISKVFNLQEYLPVIEQAQRLREPVRLSKINSPFRQMATERFFDLLVYPLTETGEDGMVIHIDDVTDRVMMQDRMVQADKMQSIGGLAAGFAHEINNPLAIILQNTQVMERRLSPDLAKNRETAAAVGSTMAAIGAYVRARGCDGMLRAITDAGSRAAKIVENMQIFSRRSVSDALLQNLEDVVEGAIDLAVTDYDMRRHLNFRQITVMRDFEPVPQIRCITGQIQQCLLILLKNAAQALVGAEHREIRLRIKLRDEMVCLQVEDNGEGMNEEMCRRVFDPFYTTREVGSGVGLGLSTAYYIVTQNHHGRMQVQSRPKEGTCFEICLPLEES